MTNLDSGNTANLNDKQVSLLKWYQKNYYQKVKLAEDLAVISDHPQEVMVDLSSVDVEEFRPNNLIYMIIYPNGKRVLSSSPLNNSDNAIRSHAEVSNPNLIKLGNILLDAGSVRMSRKLRREIYSENNNKLIEIASLDALINDTPTLISLQVDFEDPDPNFNKHEAALAYPDGRVEKYSNLLSAIAATERKVWMIPDLQIQ